MNGVIYNTTPKYVEKKIYIKCQQCSFKKKYKTDRKNV